MPKARLSAGGSPHACSSHRESLGSLGGKSSPAETPRDGRCGGTLSLGKASASASLTTRVLMAACGGEEERESEQVHFRPGGFLTRHILKENGCVKRLEGSVLVCQTQALSSLGFPGPVDSFSPPLLSFPGAKRSDGDAQNSWSAALCHPAGGLLYFRGLGELTLGPP